MADDTRGNHIAVGSLDDPAVAKHGSERVVVLAADPPSRTIERQAAEIAELRAEVVGIRADKNGAYFERNQCATLIARMALMNGWRAGVTRTNIEGWDPEWHGCVYIDLPTGQVSWHFHDSQAYLFDGLPDYAGTWDGHDTSEKYRRVNNCLPPPPTTDTMDGS